MSIQPRHDCMSSPFVACFLSKYYWKKFNSFKKKRDEKDQEYKFKSPRYWSGQQKEVLKYWLTITVIAHFPKILFPWRDTHLSSLSNLKDLNFFLQLRPAWLASSPAGVTCCEMRKYVASFPSASCVVKPMESCGGSAGTQLLWQPSANTSYSWPLPSMGKTSPGNCFVHFISWCNKQAY